VLGARKFRCKRSTRARALICGALALAGATTAVAWRAQAATASAGPTATCVGGGGAVVAAAPAQPAAAPEAAGTDAGASQTVHVVVPPGALYLEPGHATAHIRAGERSASMPDILVADLRDERGWQLELTATAVRGAARVRVAPAPLQRIAGEAGSDPRRGPTAALDPGGCTVVAVAGAESTRGSWFQPITLLVDGERTTGPVEVDVDVRLVSRR
jgi:hypothetical protein